MDTDVQAIRVKELNPEAKVTILFRELYLGGLGDDADPKLSPHLRSRHEVGEILRQSGVETIEFRASLVIGTGSLSFDLVRSLTDRLPVIKNLLVRHAVG